MATFAGSCSAEEFAAGGVEPLPASTASKASAGRTVHAAVALAEAVEAGSGSTPPAAASVGDAEPANVAIPVPPPIVAPRAFVLLGLALFHVAVTVVLA